VTLDLHPTIHDPGVQVRTHQPDYSRIARALAQPVYQDVMVDPVEELRQVHVHHHALARLHVGPRGLDRVVCPPSGSEPVAVFAEGGVDQGLQHLQQRLLDQPIQHRRDAQLALAPVRFGNHHPSHRLGPVRARQQRLAGLRPTRAQQLGRVLDVEPVHSSRALVGLDTLPRRLLRSLSSAPPPAGCQPPHLRPCQPCARVLMGRAAGFVTGSFTPGFTVRYPHPPGLLRHLTHGL
jgi:hypothetical protein